MLSVNDALSYDRDAIGIGRKGTIDRPYILKAPFWTVDTLFYAIPREKVDLNYAFDIFQNIDWKKKDESTGVPSLSKTAINDIDVLAPKHDEQQIIGQFFAAIDNLITLHQRQSFSHSTPDISLSVQLIHPFYTSSWEQRKFGDLADYKKGPFGSAITKDMFVPKSEESIKVYEQQNAINKDWELERYFLPKEYALTKLKSFEVHGGDIIVSCAGTIGEIYEIPENADTGVINQALMRVRVDEDCVDKRMFKIAFSNMIDDFTRVHSNGSAIKNIPPFSDLKPMGVLLPSLQEQEKISSYFEKLDNLITLHQRKGKAAVSGCSNDANNSKGVCCKARDFGYKCHKKDESK